jgi:peroxisomal membrane protein 4
MLLIRYLNPINSGKEGPYDTFFAGLIGGYAVFGRGRQGSVNKQVQIHEPPLPSHHFPILCPHITDRLTNSPFQIVIFVFARVMLALARLSVSTPSPSVPIPTFPTQLLSPQLREKIRANAWPVFASLSWAFVMFIFRWKPDSIQPSLRSSMKYMYVSTNPVSPVLG